MRKCLFLIPVLFVCQLLYGQKDGSSLQLGIGIGTANNFYKTYIAGVGAGGRLTLEGRIKRWERTRVEAGGILAYSWTDAIYRLSNPDWKARYIWQNVLLGVRGTFVYEYDEHLEFYSGLHLGLRFLDFKEKYENNPPAGYASPALKPVWGHIGIFAGSTYKITPRASVFGELGFDMIWFNIGIKLKLMKDEQ